MCTVISLSPPRLMRKCKSLPGFAWTAAGRANSVARVGHIYVISAYAQNASLLAR
jgi:hypothetical protein